MYLVFFEEFAVLLFKHLKLFKSAVVCIYHYLR